MANESKKRVLVTGANGLIGTALRNILGDKYEWSALNRRDLPGVPTTQADIADLEAIRPAFEGIDTVVHLAAVARLGEDAAAGKATLVGLLGAERARLEALFG